MKYKVWMNGGQHQETFDTPAEAEEFHDQFSEIPLADRIERQTGDGATRCLYDSEEEAAADRDGAYCDRIEEVE
jgi:hypothetical protein